MFHDVTVWLNNYLNKTKLEKIHQTIKVTVSTTNFSRNKNSWDVASTRIIVYPTEESLAMWWEEQLIINALPLQFHAMNEEGSNSMYFAVPTFKIQQGYKFNWTYWNNCLYRTSNGTKIVITSMSWGTTWEGWLYVE